MRMCCVGLVLVAAVVGSWAMVGCISQPESPDEADPPQEPSELWVGGVNQILLSGSGAVTLQNGVVYNYDVMWGPANGRACSGYIDTASNVVHLTAGYAYIAGRLPKNALGAVIVPWPVLVTDHVEGAADGTILMVEIDDGKERVYRLDPTRSSKVSARVPPGDWKSTSDPAKDMVMQWDSGTNTVGAAVELSTTQLSFRNNVVNTAYLRGIRIPLASP